MREPEKPVLLVANSSWNLSHLRAGLIAGLKPRVKLAAVVPVGEAPVEPLPTYHIPLRPAGIAPHRELPSLLALIRLFRSVRPAAVCAFTPKGCIYAGLACRATGTPFLPNVSGLGTGFIRGGLLKAVQSALYKEAFRVAPTVFLQNREDAALFTAEGLVGAEQVHVIPGSGVDCRAFTAKPLKRRKAGAAEILFVGRLLGDKGVRELAEAMRLLRPRYPDLKLTLLGELGAANHSAITADELAGWVGEGLLTHAGRTDDVRPFIAKADAVVLPSYREGMPKSLLEAAAMGRPLLASNVPGCREIVRPGVNGLLFEARSPTSLAEALAGFADAPHEQRQAWGRAARRIAEEEYDERLVVDAYWETLGRLLAARP